MHAYLDTPIGPIKIIGDEKNVSEIQFIKHDELGEDAPTTCLLEAKKQLIEYFQGKRKQFDLELNLSKGTDFQKKVWLGLIDIPYGKTKTYGQLAVDIYNPGAQRAVGGANNKNPIPIIIPCHRVVASNGLGGFALGPEVKKWLLDHEKTA